MDAVIAELRSESIWLWRGQIALVLGTVAFIALLLPIATWQYRRYGSLNVRRFLGGAGASLYLTAIVSYTALPLPDRNDVHCRSSSLELLHSLQDVQAAGTGAGLSGLLTSRTFLQIILNVVFFLPWGIGVRGFLGRSVLAATISGAAVSMLIEVTQGTALWGRYPCPYRVADIDDVLMNTVGAFIGAVIAPAILWWMPRRSDLTLGRLLPRPVTSGRRWMAMIIEFIALHAISLSFVLAAGVAPLVLHVTASDDMVRLAQPIGAVVAWLVVFAIPALRGHGSVGLRAVWLVPIWPEGRWGSRLRHLARASVISGPWLASQLRPAGWLDAFVWAIALLALASVPFTRNRRGLSGWITSAALIDSRTPPTRTPISVPDATRVYAPV